MTGGRFSTSSKCIDHGIGYLAKVKERLQGVVIEQKDFADLIKVYDREKALFYLDPPYVGTEKYYNVSFSKEDHYRLKETLKKIEGRFILSYNNDVFIRELYSEYIIREINRKNTLTSKGNQRDYAELIITNF